MPHQVQYNARSQPNRKKVWYAGTDQLDVGYNLDYDVAATKDATPVKTALGNQVVKPATANLNAYAGVVAVKPPSAGPCYVEIFVPEKGECCEALCNANATAFTTVLGPQDGSYALAAKADSTFNLAAVAKAAETADTSVTAANKLIQF